MFCTVLSAQTDMDKNLAIQFYQNQEYDKAVELFEKLYKKDSEADIYYRYLLNCYIVLQQFDDAEKMVKKRVKKNEGDPRFVVDLGFVYQQMGDIKARDKQFEDALKILPADQMTIRNVANAFVGYGEQELAAATYERGRELLRQPGMFNFELADIYTRANNKEKAVENYIDLLSYNPGAIQSIKNKLQDRLAEDDWYEQVRTQVLLKVQKTNNEVFSELLIWTYLQRSDYTSAFIQARALDKRNNENGFRVLELARSAKEEKEYDAAVDAYQYVIEKGRNSSVYQTAKQELLALRKEKVTTSYQYTQEDMDALMNGYNEFLREFGLSRYTVPTLLEKAQLQAFYMHDLDSAITTIEALLKIPQLDKMMRGQAKIELGDYYLLKGEDWEASLLYSQVDKDLGDGILGEMARFKNAKLSYYQGDFEWSQAQLDILKGSTSELIANDALQLSVFIMDNFGLDTTTYPMEKFAQADLLFFQNKLDESLSTLDSITRVFPNHSLADDIAYKRAHIYLKKQDLTNAAKYYQLILDRYAEDLLGDNATFELAELYEGQLNDKDKAMQLYQDLILNYHDSVLVVEARKRFRKLRGDEL